MPGFLFSVLARNLVGSGRFENPVGILRMGRRPYPSRKISPGTLRLKELPYLCIVIKRKRYGNYD